LFERKIKTRYKVISFTKYHGVKTFSKELLTKVIFFFDIFLTSKYVDNYFD